MHIEFWPKNLKERDHSERLDVDGKITLEWMLGKCVRRCEHDASVSGYGPEIGC